MRAALKNVMSHVDRQAWIRFFIALGGLTLAFAAALLSTVARESGNLLATAILASSALLLAGVVGVVTVPYLAKRVAIERVRDAFSYDVTKEGIVYLAFALVIAIAALNTGNNLLFLVVSVMLGAVVVSGIASAVVLNGIEVDFDLPLHIFAQQSYMAVLSVRNRRRFTSAFSVTVLPARDKGARKTRWSWERSTFTFPSGKKGRKSWVRWPDYSLTRVHTEAESRALFAQSLYFPYIPAQQTVRAEVELKFEQRGRYQQRAISIATRFPFSFLVKTRTVALVRDVVVYPSVEPTDEFFDILPMMTGEFESHYRGRGYDLYRIRDYQPEDSARHVDWKSTAKSGELKVREFTREDERKLRIVFDNPVAGQATPERYERGVALAASLAWHFAGQETDLSYVSPGYVGNDLYGFLGYLASIQPGDGQSTLDDLQVTDDYNVILTARSRGTIPTALWQSSYFVFLSE